MKQKFAIKKIFRAFKIIDTVTQESIEFYKKLEKNQFHNNFEIGDILVQDEDDFTIVFSKKLIIKKSFYLSDKGVNKMNLENTFEIVDNKIIGKPIKAIKCKYLEVDSANLKLAKFFDKTARIGDIAIFDLYPEIISKAQFELNYEPI